MAMDAENMDLQGMVYQDAEPIWGACPCCNGVDYENCPNCSVDEIFKDVIRKETRSIMKDIF